MYERPRKFALGLLSGAVLLATAVGSAGAMTLPGSPDGAAGVSTQIEKAYWVGPGYGWRGPGWRGPGWGWRGPGWRGNWCYWHPRACAYRHYW